MIQKNLSLVYNQYILCNLLHSNHKPVIDVVIISNHEKQRKFSEGHVVHPLISLAFAKTLYCTDFNNSYIKTNFSVYSIATS